MITYITHLTIIFIQERSSSCRSVLVCVSGLEAAQGAGWMVPCLPPCSVGDSENQPKEVWTVGRYHSRQGTAFDHDPLLHQYNNKGQVREIVDYITCRPSVHCQLLEVMALMGYSWIRLDNLFI